MSTFATPSLARSPSAVTARASSRRRKAPRSPSDERSCWRRSGQENTDIQAFLDDPDAELATEAARAINDVPIEAAFPKLAKLIDRRNLSEPLAFRVLNANFRLGEKENANAVARFAVRNDAGNALRLEALRMLEMWAEPPGRDRIMGVWRPLVWAAPCENPPQARGYSLRNAHRHGNEPLKTRLRQHIESVAVSCVAAVLRTSPIHRPEVNQGARLPTHAQHRHGGPPNRLQSHPFLAPYPNP